MTQNIEPGLKLRGFFYISDMQYNTAFVLYQWIIGDIPIILMSISLKQSQNYTHTELVLYIKFIVMLIFFLNWTLLKVCK